MSSLHDPFDLIKQDGPDMDNVIPFLSNGKIDQMINTALAHQQLAPKRKGIFSSRRVWWSGGMATAACILLLVFFAPTQVLQPAPSQVAIQISADDIGEFSELVMLDTLDTY